MKKIIFAFLVIFILAISCKKDKTAPAVVADKYMSLSANSSWTYETTDNINSDSVAYIITSTNRDSTINNKTYHVFSNSGGANQYYAIIGNDYYTFQNLPVTLGSNAVENIYLKDNLDVNSGWSQSYNISVSGLPLTVNLVNTITEKNSTKTVNGIVYTGVIHVTTTLTASVLGTPLPASAITTDIESYYAKKVGMIQSKNKISIDYAGNTGDIDQDTYLKQSDIK